MSQEQLHRPDEEHLKSPMPSPVQSPDASTIGQLQGSPVDATLVSEELKRDGHAVTYGDVFPAVADDQGPLSGEAVTTEDASLMQTAEAMAFGHTLKYGAASAMQSAAAKNVQGGWVERDAHSKVSELGLGVSETVIPGAVMGIEFVAGQPVAASARPTPTDPAIAALDAVTIGEALEAVAMGAGDKPVEDSDARAIESAESRATGVPMPTKGGIGSTAQSAAQLNLRTVTAGKTTLADILTDATIELPADKVVTYEDAYKVMQAELRGRDADDLQPGGVGATLVAAAELNALSGSVPPPPHLLADDSRPSDVDEEADLLDDAELHQYRPMESADLSKSSQGEGLPEAFRSDSLDDAPTRIEATGEETAPLVSSTNADEKLSSRRSSQLSSTQTSL